MTKLFPLLARDRYSAEGWEYASAGRCDWNIATDPVLQLCGRPSWPGSYYRYCDEHDEQARDSWNYGR